MSIEIMMFGFMLLMGVFFFGFPLVNDIPKEHKTYVNISQFLVFIASILAGINDWSDIKSLLTNRSYR